MGAAARQWREGETGSAQVQGGSRQWRRMRRSRLARARRHGRQPKVSQTAACAHASNGDTLIHGTARRRSGPPALCLKLDDDTERAQNEAQHSSARYHPCVRRALSFVGIAPHFDLDPSLLCPTTSEASSQALDNTMSDELAPPRKSVELQDPGAKELGMCSSCYHSTHC